MKTYDMKFNDGEKIYFTSDTHFNHENIIKFCNRPYNSVAEMNNDMIEKWNNKVPKDALVFHLGDFAYGKFADTKEIRDKLNGKIILIKGNHDWKNNASSPTQEKILFENVYNQLLIKIDKRYVYLNHYPFLCYAGTYSDVENQYYQLFGHVHSRKQIQTIGKDDERLKYLFPTQYDVGVDNNDFTPLSWSDVDNIISYQVNYYYKT